MKIVFRLLAALTFLLGNFAIAADEHSIISPELQAPRQLASENPETDVIHYQSLARRMGISLGMLIPQGDFASAFGSAPAIGLHYTWEAIKPFGFSLSMTHAASTYKGNAASGKLAITEIGICTIASFPMQRLVPFIKFGGALLFNHVSFDGARLVTAGNDTNLTTVGLIGGLGMDFVVGREVGLGFEALYHYAVPKTLNTSTTDFNLGSSFITVNMRLNF